MVGINVVTCALASTLDDNIAIGRVRVGAVVGATSTFLVKDQSVKEVPVTEHGIGRDVVAGFAIACRGGVDDAAIRFIFAVIHFPVTHARTARRRQLPERRVGRRFHRGGSGPPCLLMVQSPVQLPVSAASQYDHLPSKWLPVNRATNRPQ